MSNLYHCATEYVKQLTIYKRFYPLNIYNLNIFNVGPPAPKFRGRTRDHLIQSNTLTSLATIFFQRMGVLLIFKTNPYRSLNEIRSSLEIWSLGNDYVYFPTLL
jgi:hypothetical protein